jgi:hypothetical protein
MKSGRCPICHLTGQHQDFIYDDQISAKNLTSLRTIAVDIGPETSRKPFSYPRWNRESRVSGKAFGVNVSFEELPFDDRSSIIPRH